MGFLVGAKRSPQNSIFVRLNLGTIRQDLALGKDAKMSKLEGIAFAAPKSVHSQSIDTGACASVFAAGIVLPASCSVVNRPASVQR
jgi:hypothetical protein